MIYVLNIHIIKAVDFWTDGYGSCWVLSSIQFFLNLAMDATESLPFVGEVSGTEDRRDRYGLGMHFACIFVLLWMYACVCMCGRM